MASDSEQLPRSQFPDQSAIRRQKLILRQVFQPRPQHLRINLVVQFAVKFPHHKKLQVNRAAVPVIMADVRHPGPHLGGDTYLLLQLSYEGLLGALPRLDLAPREFPLQCHRLVRTALTNQHFPTPHNERSGNKPQCSQRRFWLAVFSRLIHVPSVPAEFEAALFQQVAEECTSASQPPLRPP
jgi:hypothetical protein